MTGLCRPQAVTRVDVARRAGTSTAVVSYVLNGGPRPVAVATRARVQAAIDELGYRPDRIARALAARRSEAFGLVVSDITNPFVSDVSRAIEAAASERGYTVLLANSAIDTDRERRHIQDLLDRRVDGLLMIPVGLDEASIAELNQSGVPVTVLDRPVPGLNATTILVDNAGGASEITRHLVGHGHRRVACITGRLALHPAAERERGWADAVGEAGLSRSRCPVIRTLVNRRAGYAAGLRLLGRAHPPTAVFVATDEQAFGVLRAAADLGRRVPDDLAVASFDGIAQAAYSVPGLTTASQPVDEMGWRAVTALLEANLTGETEVLPVHVVRRGSCGCPDSLDGRDLEDSPPLEETRT
jgi:LacI family transcriptional regulator